MLTQNFKSVNVYFLVCKHICVFDGRSLDLLVCTWDIHHLKEAFLLWLQVVIKVPKFSSAATAALHVQKPSKERPN